jgi:hypothetical protein
VVGTNFEQIIILFVAIIYREYDAATNTKTTIDG